MLDILNLVLLAATMVSNITLYSDEAYPIAEPLDSVTAVSLHREFWREDGNGKCKYTGLMVPFARDWEEEVSNGAAMPNVRPPEPNKVAGQAFIIDRKVCGEKVEPVLRAGFIYSTSGSLRYKHTVQVYDVNEMKKPHERPKWLEQVLRRVERTAYNNSASRDFVVRLKANTEKLPAELVTLVSDMKVPEPVTASVQEAKEAPVKEAPAVAKPAQKIESVFE